MNDIEKLAFQLLKDSGYTEEEIKDFREAADHPYSCRCEKCKKLIDNQSSERY